MIHVLLKPGLENFEHYFASMRWVQLCSSLNILWHCPSLGLEWKMTFSSAVATAEFSKFAGIPSAASACFAAEEKQKTWIVQQRSWTMAEGPLPKEQMRAVCYAQSLSCVRLPVIPWTVARQGPLSLGFSKQECQNGLPFPLPGDLPNTGIKPTSHLLHWQMGSLPLEPPGNVELKR